MQGDRTVGINHKPSDGFLSSLRNNTGINPPINHGHDSVASVLAMLEGDARVFLSMGGNFVSAMSDTASTSKAIQNCDLTVQISTKPNRSHLVTGNTALILPCLGRTEKDVTSHGKQFVSVENSMGVVHSSRGNARPASNDLMSEPSIVSGIASALDEKVGDSGILWSKLSDDYDLIRDLIESAIPGFDSYNERVREPSGFYLPNPPRDSRTFNTDSGKANFRVHSISAISVERDQFVMMTIRSHDQYNTTIYGLDDRYRGIKQSRRIVLMCKKDMERLGIKTGAMVDLTSHFEGDTLTAPKWRVVEYDIPSGNIATYFPEANCLIPLNSVAKGSNTPTSKSVCVTVQPTVQNMRFWNSKATQAA